MRRAALRARARKPAARRAVTTPATPTAPTAMAAKQAERRAWGAAQKGGPALDKVGKVGMDGGFHRQSFHFDTEDTGPAYTQVQIQHRSRAPGPPFTGWSSRKKILFLKSPGAAVPGTNTVHTRTRSTRPAHRSALSTAQSVCDVHSNSHVHVACRLSHVCPRRARYSPQIAARSPQTPTRHYHRLCARPCARSTPLRPCRRLGLAPLEQRVRPAPRPARLCALCSRSLLDRPQPTLSKP